MKNLKRSLFMSLMVILTLAFVGCAGAKKTEMNFAIENNTDTVINTVALMTEDMRGDSDSWIYLLTSDLVPIGEGVSCELPASIPEDKLGEEWYISVRGEVEEGVGVGRQAAIGPLNNIGKIVITFEEETYAIEVTSAD